MLFVFMIPVSGVITMIVAEPARSAMERALLAMAE